MIKKQINVGTFGAGNPPHFDRFVYAKKFKNAQNEAKATKQMAISWFRKYKRFSMTVPHKSYTQALINPVPGEKSSIQRNSPSSKDACRGTSNGRVSPHLAVIKSASKTRNCNDLPTVETGYLSNMVNVFL